MLTLKNVSIRYGTITAVRKISLSVKDKEIVCVIGPNGAGKSTVLMSISGIIRAHEGCILFQGKDITRSRSDEIVKDGIVHVPEGRMIFSRMSVHENILMGAFCQKYSREELTDQMDMIFAQFPILRDRLYLDAGSLSGGEQQMLSIARGLVAKPKLFMLDEPSLGLAPIIVSEIFVALEDLNRLGLTILLVEQNAKKALEIAKRASVLESGTLIMEDMAANLLENENIKKAYLGG